MDFHELVRSRRSIREFHEKGVSDELIMKLLDTKSICFNCCLCRYSEVRTTV